MQHITFNLDSVVEILSRGRDADEGSRRRVQNETFYLAELVAVKRKVNLQQYTPNTNSGEQSVGRR